MMLTNSNLIVEQSVFSEAKIIKQTPTKAIFRCPIQTVDEVNQNGRMYPKGVLDLNLDSRINKYYEFLEEKINKINSSNLDIIVNEIERNFDKINHELHRRKYKYILKWKEVLLNKYKQYAN